MGGGYTPPHTDMCLARWSVLGSLEGGGHRRSPVEGAGRALKGISEGLEEAGGMREETAIKVNEAEKTLEVFNSLWLGIV